MASFAKLNNSNIVTQVVAVNNDILLDSNNIEQEQLGIDFLKNLYNEPDAKWVQTSYNTWEGKYYNTNPISDARTLGDQSKAFRKNHASIGYTYDEIKDAFIPPKPSIYNSWILDENTCAWKPPINKPIEPLLENYAYDWDETTISWVIKEIV